MKTFIIVIFVILALGCTAKPNLATQPLEVSLEELPQYWEMKFNSFSFSTSFSRETMNKPKGYVKIRYLIDSNGAVFEPEVVESVPEGVWDKHGLKAVKQMEYEPASNNTSRAPVYVTTEFQFEASINR